MSLLFPTSLRSYKIMYKVSVLFIDSQELTVILIYISSAERQGI